MRNIIAIICIVISITIAVFLVFSLKGTSVKEINKPQHVQIQPTSQNSNNLPLVTVITDHLEVPWAIAFLPDGRMFVTERPGRVQIVSMEGKKILAATIKVDVENDGEGGLLGIALHPNFEFNHFVYLYYTYRSQSGSTLNRVVRMSFDNDRLTDETIIVDRIPGALYHNGGRIKFGPDGYLYITTGDARDSNHAQDKNSLAGKILRVTDDGKSAPGNPFNNLVYSYGHRNPQGLAWDSAGQLWETEHGRSNPTGYDEVNLIEPGKNYGWEVIQGDEQKPGMVSPKINSGSTTTWAPSGAAFVSNSMYFAGLKGQTLYEAVIANNRLIELNKHFVGKYGRLREVVVGPDGMLYITTSNRDGRGTPSSDDDILIRVNPDKL